MPITATIKCASNGRAVELLKNNPTLGLRIATSRKYGEVLIIDVLSLLVAEDIYGRKYEVTPVNFGIWASAKLVPVLFEPNFSSLDIAGCIGSWNLAFLQWLKAISLEAGEDIEIEYKHERGDMLYESAWWGSYPASAEIVEVFGIQSNDGRDTSEWRKAVLRYRNGRIEMRLE